MESKKKKSKVPTIMYICVMLLLIGFTVLNMTQYMKITIVNGKSMSPTLENGSILIMLKGKPKRGDLAIFERPEAWKSDVAENVDFLIKRAVAVPGDTVTVKGKILYVNNEKIVDLRDYFNALPEDFKGSITLRSGEYFMVGDNYGKSTDSLSRWIRGEGSFFVSDRNITHGRELVRFGGK